MHSESYYPYTDDAVESSCRLFQERKPKYRLEYYANVLLTL